MDSLTLLLSFHLPPLKAPSAPILPSPSPTPRIQLSLLFLDHHLHLKNLQNISLMSSPRSFSGADRRHHFLDSYFLCKKPLASNEDIFMYRGDAAFCSRECRWEQMDMDEALEKETRRRRPASIAAVASACSGKTRCIAADTAPIFPAYKLIG